MDWLLCDNGLRHEELKWGKNEEKCWVQHILWSSKLLFCFWIDAYIFFQMVISQRCFDEKHNVVSTLFYVVNFNVDIHNVVSTLIWRCATSRRHINLKATLNGRWNVCWIDSLPNTLKSSQATMWLQSSMWSLTEIDNVPFKCLPVRGDTPWCFQTLTFMCLKVFPNIWSIAVSALKIIDLART